VRAPERARKKIRALGQEARSMIRAELDPHAAGRAPPSAGDREGRRRWIAAPVHPAEACPGAVGPHGCRPVAAAALPPQRHPAATAGPRAGWPSSFRPPSVLLLHFGPATTPQVSCEMPR
jgi:hypothetical protein